MYLARLKKYGPKLNCVVTLTEELALHRRRRPTGDSLLEIQEGRCTESPGVARTSSPRRGS